MGGTSTESSRLSGGASASSCSASSWSRSRRWVCRWPRRSSTPRRSPFSSVIPDSTRRFSATATSSSLRSTLTKRRRRTSGSSTWTPSTGWSAGSWDSVRATSAARSTCRRRGTRTSSRCPRPTPVRGGPPNIANVFGAQFIAFRRDADRAKINQATTLVQNADQRAAARRWGRHPPEPPREPAHRAPDAGRSADRQRRGGAARRRSHIALVPEDRAQHGHRRPRSECCSRSPSR